MRRLKRNERTQLNLVHHWLLRHSRGWPGPARPCGPAKASCIRSSRTRFGWCAPSIEMLHRALSGLWGETVVPDGAGAADRLGLTGQNSVRLVYLTSGRNRLRHIGTLPRRDESRTALAVGGPKPAGGSCHPGLGRVENEAAVSGNLRLIPSGTAQDVRADDYGRMLVIGILLGEDEPLMSSWRGPL